MPSIRAIQSAQGIPILPSNMQSDPSVLDLRLRSLDGELAECITMYQSITADEASVDKRYKEIYNSLVAKYDSVETELTRLGSTPECFEKAIRKIVRKEIDKQIHKRVNMDEILQMLETRYLALKNRVETQSAKNCARINRSIAEVDSMDNGFDEDDPRYSLTEERIDYLMIALQKISV